MKLLFDQNLSVRLCVALEKVFPGCLHVGPLGLSQASDRDIWDYAKEHGLIIVTQDVDFRDMVALQGPPPKVIWLRSGNQPTSIIARILGSQIARIRAFDLDADSACLEIYGRS